MFAAELSGGMWEPGYPSGTKAINFGTAGNMNDRLGYSFALLSDYGNAYAETSDSGEAGESVIPGQMMFCAGVAYRFLNVFSLGLGARYTSQGLGPDALYQAVSGTASLMFQAAGIRATAGIKDLGSKLAGEYPLPARAFAGADYTRSFGVHAVEVAAEANIYLSGAFSAGAGVSYTFKDMLVARAGYILGGSSATANAITLGLGGKYKGVRLDAAYLISAAPVGNSFTLGLGFSMQRPPKRPVHIDTEEEK